MKMKCAGGFLAVTMLAGLLMAYSPRPVAGVQAEGLPRAVHHELAEQQVGRIPILDSAREPVLGEMCGRDAGERLDPLSDAMRALTVLEGNRTELERFGAAPELLGSGPSAAPSGCPTRRCRPDATFLGCCSRTRVLGTDHLGACSIRILCRDI